MSLEQVSLISQILKAPSKQKLYRDYKVFQNWFNNDLKSKLDSIKNLDYCPFEDKIIAANNHEFMSKALRKGIMTRSRLKNVYLKIKIQLIGITTSINESFVLIFSEKQNFFIFATLM